MALSLSSLITAATKTELYAQALQIATDIGLTVTSWAAGDPTRSYYHFFSEVLATVEEGVVEYVKAGFLDYAEGTENAWLILLAKQVFDVDAVEATYASTSVALTNASGAVYDIDAGDLTFKNTATDKTYTNTSGGTLAGGGGTLSVDVVADEAGSDSSAGAGDIDDLVTTMLGVTVTNPSAAVGVDAESAPTLRQRCRDKLGSLSPDGPAAAYAFVARTPELAGTSAVTRVRVSTANDTGTVTVYLAGPSGTITEPARVLVEAAIELWATPNAVTPLVVAVEEQSIAVTYELWLYSTVNKTSAEVQAAVAEALATMFSERPIAGDIIAPATTGKIYKTMIESTIRGVFAAHAFRVSVSAPAGDTSLDISEVATLGTVTPTITFETAP